MQRARGKWSRIASPTVTVHRLGPAVTDAALVVDELLARRAADRDPPEDDGSPQLSPTASRDELGAAYRRLVKRHSPDGSGDRETFARVREVHPYATAGGVGVRASARQGH